jgi:hypothetical protein
MDCPDNAGHCDLRRVANCEERKRYDSTRKLYSAVVYSYDNMYNVLNESASLMLNESLHYLMKRPPINQ